MIVTICTRSRNENKALRIGQATHSDSEIIVKEQRKIQSRIFDCEVGMFVREILKD